MPTSSSVDSLSACSVFITTALQLGHLQREKETEESGEHERRGRSPRSECRSTGPPLTRRVSASASPRGQGGGEGAAIERSVSSDGYESSNKRGGDFYEYWSYYNSRPASIVRSATSEMADDILSSGDDDGITAPIPSTAATTTTTTAAATAATATRAQPTTTEGARGAKGAGESAAVNESKRTRAAGEAARAFRAVAVAEERWAKEAKLRLQELRNHSGNR